MLPFGRAFFERVLKGAEQTETYSMFQIILLVCFEVAEVQ